MARTRPSSRGHCESRPQQPRPRSPSLSEQPRPQRLSQNSQVWSIRHFLTRDPSILSPKGFFSKTFSATFQGPQSKNFTRNLDNDHWSFNGRETKVDVCEEVILVGSASFIRGVKLGTSTSTNLYASLSFGTNEAGSLIRFFQPSQHCYFLLLELNGKVFTLSFFMRAPSLWSRGPKRRENRST